MWGVCGHLGGASGMTALFLRGHSLHRITHQRQVGPRVAKKGTLVSLACFPNCAHQWLPPGKTTARTTRTRRN